MKTQAAYFAPGIRDGTRALKKKNSSTIKAMSNTGETSTQSTALMQRPLTMVCLDHGTHIQRRFGGLEQPEDRSSTPVKPTGMPQLQEERCSSFTHCVRDRLPRVNLFLCIDARRVRVPADGGRKEGCSCFHTLIKRGLMLKAQQSQHKRAHLRPPTSPGWQKFLLADNRKTNVLTHAHLWQLPWPRQSAGSLGRHAADLRAHMQWSWFASVNQLLQHGEHRQDPGPRTKHPF